MNMHKSMNEYELFGSTFTILQYKLHILYENGNVKMFFMQ